MTAARKLQAHDTGIASAEVLETQPALRVRLHDEVFEARRAKSCLVAPDPGDRVLVAVEPDAVFVLAVLTGAEATRIACEAELAIEAPRLAVRAEEGTVAVTRLGFFAGIVDAQLKKVSLLADDLDTMAERITQRAKRVMRFVEELDQLRAGTVDVRAESLAAIRAENALISARVLAKIDGEQINLG